ncbi:MAG: hypothetical protein EPO09_13475 [Aquabacterium sp.]|uniref:peptidylprolyl isomerase n=1 Tax=Aquabacterium sp. TaxID=1872578 RepID=UPI0011F4C4CB|nr:peptidylprolyl isomerase [Aquabacterium sp.]TAK93187.1 MAG: hypothetical protein EPO09_13475 [Aquabacterium sp.]
MSGIKNMHRVLRRLTPWWASMLLATCLATTAMAEEVVNAEAYPPNAYRCAVLAGGTGSRFGDAKVDGFWREVNREVWAQLADQLRTATYDFDAVFTEASDSNSKTPLPKPLLAVARSRCAQLIQISHDIGEDKDGRYFSFDLAVLRFRSKGRAASAQPGTSVVPYEDYSKHYRFARTEEALSTFSPTKLAGQIFQELIASHVLESIKGARPVTEAMMRDEYERTVPSTGEQEYKARHILVATREQAQAVIARIKAGEAFDALAKTLSIDTGSGQVGGELGWAAPGVYVKEFDQAMIGLSPKGLSAEPVQSAFGWHVIELLDTRPTPRPSFESMKAMISARLRQKLRRDKP